MPTTHDMLVQAAAFHSLTCVLAASLGATPALALDLRTEGLPRLSETEINQYTEHVHVLASEYMQGRKPGTQGIERAAKYIEWHFEQLGLDPAFPLEETAADGQVVVSTGATFRQPFQIGTTAALDDQHLAFTSPGHTIELEGGSDFSTLAYGSSGTLESAPVTFVGYSIVAGQGDYTSYKDVVDLTGKVAMILRFEPMGADGTSAWRDSGWSFAAGLPSKFRAAESRGAAAILLVTPPGADDERVGELDTVEDTNRARPVNIPVMHVTPEVAARMVELGDPDGRTLEALIDASNEAGVIADLSDISIDLQAQISREPTMTDNVGAVLRGKGHLADEYIVMGAHYDHLGYATYGSRKTGELHLGADDNASGTAGLLTAAGTLAGVWDQIDGPVRSVLFLAFSAEETGLNGSKHYVENPIAPLDDHTLMINTDMIGSLRSHLETGGVGTGEGLAELAAPVYERAGVEVNSDLSVGSGRSDHASFDRKQVPNIFFFTGVTDQYHTPDDTVDTLNLEGAATIAHLSADLALAAAVRENELAYIQQNTQDPGSRRQMGGPGGIKIRVGIAPGDYSGGAEGVQVASVFPGTSAADAGIQAGDRITVWNGERVATVMDWMPMLASHEPGDTIDITIVRDGDELTIPITLKAKRSTRE